MPSSAAVSSASSTSAPPPPSLAPHVDVPAGERLLQWCDRNRRWLFLAIFVVYLAGFNGQWWITPDSAVALNIARNIHQGHGYFHPLGYQTQIPPGLPYLLAATMTVTGSNHVWLADLVMLIISFCGLGLTYALFKTYADRPTAVLITVLLAACRWYYQLSFQLLADMPFLIGVLVMLLGFERLHRQRGRIAMNVGLIILGVAVMAVMRTVVITVLGATVLTMAWQAWRYPRHRKIYFFAFLIAVAAVAAVFIFKPDAGAAGIGVATDKQIILGRFEHLRQTLTVDLPANAWQLFGDEATSAVLGLELIWWVSLVVSTLMIFFGLMLVRRRPLWGLIVLAFIVQMVIFLPTARYLLAFLPLLVFAWWSAGRWLEKHLPAPTGSILCIAMIVIWFGCNFVKTLELTVRQRLTPYLQHVDHGSNWPAVQMARIIAARTPRRAVVIAAEALDSKTEIIMYLSHRLVVPAHMVEPKLIAGRPCYALFLTQAADGALQATAKRDHWRLGPTAAHVPASGHAQAASLVLRPILSRSP